MMGCKLQILLALSLSLCIAVYAQDAAASSVRPTSISLFPTGKCNGPDGKTKKCGDGLPACGCPGFQCAGCPGCPGTKFVGSCLPNNVAILCAAPNCEDIPVVCKSGQSCESDGDCKSCGTATKCRSCPVCPGQKKKGTCRKDNELIACPKIGCASCEKKSCTSDSECTACGDRTLTCLKCPSCTGKRPNSGTCQKKRTGLCPVLDCKCDKRGSRCSNSSECCPRSEICFKCPPCRNFKPTSGECITRRFERPTSLRSTSFGGFGIPSCPPCLPDFDYNLRGPLP